MTCANCGSQSEGRFCSNCGAAQGAAVCPKCGHESAAGARFCNQCGTAIAAPSSGTPTGEPVGEPTGAPTGAPIGASTGAAPAGAPAGGGAQAAGAQRASGKEKRPASQAVWYMAGAFVVGIILMVAYPVYRPDRATPPPAAAALSGASAVDLSSMTPRQAADRLFNRVMQAASDNNDDEVLRFLPMAIGAHDLVEDLDADGKFHLVLLRMQGSMDDEALATAEEILAEQPGHLLGLAGAADASLALGDTASARAFFQRWLDSFDSEMAKNLPEYGDHGQVFPTTRATAEALTGND